MQGERNQAKGIQYQGGRIINVRSNESNCSMHAMLMKQ